MSLNIDELSTMDATAQAELVRRHELTPLELADAAIARIERVNPTINAVITPLFEEARKAAASPDLPDGHNNPISSQWRIKDGNLFGGSVPRTRTVREPPPGRSLVATLNLSHELSDSERSLRRIKTWQYCQ